MGRKRHRTTPTCRRVPSLGGSRCSSSPKGSNAIAGGNAPGNAAPGNAAADQRFRCVPRSRKDRISRAPRDRQRQWRPAASGAQRPQQRDQEPDQRAPIHRERGIRAANRCSEHRGRLCSDCCSTSTIGSQAAPPGAGRSISATNTNLRDTIDSSCHAMTSLQELAPVGATCQPCPRTGVNDVPGLYRTPTPPPPPSPDTPAARSPPAPPRSASPS